MTSLERFTKAMTFVQISEGGTNDDPDDRGGLTNYGISQKQYPDLDITNLKQSDALKIYYEDYWLKNHCESFQEPLATVIFDTSVNCGVYSTGRWLQDTCNRKGSVLMVDGVIGSKTLAAAMKHDPQKLMAGVLAYRLNRYSRLLDHDHDQYRFIRGWINRVADLIFYVL